MKFLAEDNKQICLVISDLHLGGGRYINGRKNILEEFHCDNELIEFINFYGRDKYFNKDIELIINGDFLDFLAIPFVPYFDDEFWTEKAAVAKIQKIVEAHQEVFFALDNFLRRPKKKITYILGNHDAELFFEKVRDFFLNQFDLDSRGKIKFIIDGEDYSPFNGVLVRHGHQYEKAHSFDEENPIKKDQDGDFYFDPPWGYLYITKIINKFKEERAFIDSIRPIRNFIIHGLIFDTYFTLRFLLANIYYFFVVIIGEAFRKGDYSIRKFFSILIQELSLFKDYEEMMLDEFEEDPNLRVLIVGHTHVPFFRNLSEGEIIINTGSWVDMYHLDFSNRQYGRLLTYAIVEYDQSEESYESTIADLNIWRGKSDIPYKSYY